MFSDNGREFCYSTYTHPYEFLLPLEDIAHLTTRVSQAQSNGIVGPFHHMFDELFLDDFSWWACCSDRYLVSPASDVGGGADTSDCQSLV